MQALMMFPFLLVRLQTKTGEFFREGLCVVSIPFSQAANVYKYLSKLLSDFVSIPFSQAANMMFQETDFFVLGQFPFLLVRLQTLLEAMSNPQAQLGFHSFQLGCKLFVLCKATTTSDSFPFLLVRLQTSKTVSEVTDFVNSFHSFQLGCKPNNDQSDYDSLIVLFPFLLVRLQTLLLYRPSFIPFSVSIPFSQAANLQALFWIMFLGGKFPFLLVRLQTDWSS